MSRENLKNVVKIYNNGVFHFLIYKLILPLNICNPDVYYPEINDGESESEVNFSIQAKQK